MEVLTIIGGSFLCMIDKRTVGYILQLSFSVILPKKEALREPQTNQWGHKNNGLQVSETVMMNVMICCFFLLGYYSYDRKILILPTCMYA